MYHPNPSHIAASYIALVTPNNPPPSESTDKPPQEGSTPLSPATRQKLLEFMDHVSIPHKFTIFCCLKEQSDMFTTVLPSKQRSAL